MSKGLEAWERVELYCENNSSLEHLLDDLETIEKELIEKDELEKKAKALEIIKKYPRCSLQRYIGFNEMVKDGYELTQEYLFNHDMPCSVEEYNIVIEVLL